MNEADIRLQRKKGLNRSQSQPVLDFTDFVEATSGGLEVERKGRSSSWRLTIFRAEK